jgi:hypothetical protein
VKPKKVRKVVALNPVARAMAINTLRKEMVNARTRVFSMHDGDQAEDFLTTVARFFTAVDVAAEADGLQKRDDFNFRELMDVIYKALCHIADMSKNGFAWDYSKAQDVSDGIEAALLLVPKISAVALNNAWHRVEQVK